MTSARLLAVAAVGLSAAACSYSRTTTATAPPPVAVAVPVAATTTYYSPSPGTTVYTFGYPGQVAPEIYIFAKVYDLDGAAKLVLDDGSVKAYPVVRPTRLSCGARAVIPHGVHFGPNTSSPYGRALFLDVPANNAVWIEDRSICLRELGRFVPVLTWRRCSIRAI